MNSRIDDALTEWAGQPPHHGLQGLEDRVLDAINHPPAPAIGAGTTLTAIMMALALGALSNAMPAASAQAAPSLAPFGAPSPLAPSTLLAGSE